ncbi:hypothetical protein RB195_016625 [Necator americanus]|uniref:Uncharacterized protein n=1 Tax=Necator americanus TaxID=51031 RepID=A0ABR1C3N6_NECAM
MEVRLHPAISMFRCCNRYTQQGSRLSSALVQLPQLRDAGAHNASWMCVGRTDGQIAALYNSKISEC